MANVLCVMAHPDDEVLGCGGTLAKHAENGDAVGIALFGRAELLDQAIAAGEILGTPMVNVGPLPDQEFETVNFASLVRAAEAKKVALEPDIIYTHHPGDLNLDHALTARAVLTAFRPKPDEKPRRIMACEVLSSTEWTFPQVFQPDWFEELNQWQLNKKHEAMLCYQSEVEKAPHPRSSDGIRNLALYRGQQSGVQWAEAFQLLRAGPF